MERMIYLGLVDLMFAYSYNLRTTEGENTVESAWTMCKLSGTLSCFEQFKHLKDTLTCCLRRCLTYPLYRNFELCNKVLKDVTILFKLGKRALLKALLEMQRLVGRHDTLYVLDRVWITDYCVWIQKASDKRIKSLASELNHYEVSKGDAGFELTEYEGLAQQNI